jgi:hypothetical protein
MPTRRDALFWGSIYKDKQNPECCPLIFIEDTATVTHTGFGTQSNPFRFEAISTGGTPAGSNGDIQFNDNGAFGADPQGFFNYSPANFGFVAGNFSTELDMLTYQAVDPNTNISADTLVIDSTGMFSFVDTINGNDFKVGGGNAFQYQTANEKFTVNHGVAYNSNFSSGSLFNLSHNNISVLSVDVNDNIGYADTRNGGVGVQAWTPTYYNNFPLVNGQQAAYNINSNWHPSAPSGNPLMTDILITSSVNLTTDDAYSYAAIRLSQSIRNTQPSNLIYGFLYAPSVPVALTAPLCGLEIQRGDVYLASDTTGNSAGRVSIRKGVFDGTNNPTAYVHIGAGNASAGDAPLKFDVGTLLTTPETGAFEFDGTNLYFTIAGVRKTFTLV